MEDDAHEPPDRETRVQEMRAAGVRRLALFALAFGSGFAVLTIEIAGARLIAPVFGLSAVPWTAVIGVILTALALGSHLGGRLADGKQVPLSVLLAVAGLTAALPIVGVRVPWMARDLLGFVAGSVASAVILFAPSVLCLGAVVPYLVQADTEALGAVGRRAGDMSAAATAGSIVGTFATGFILLPAFPLPVLVALTGAMLLVMAVVSGRIVGRSVSGTLAAFGALGLGILSLTASSMPADTLHQEQTLYSSVRVTEREWPDGRMVRELWQNGGSSSAEYVGSGDPAHEYAIASGLILEPVIGRVDRMLVLGGAALSLPVAFQRGRPDLTIDVVEIDPVVTDLARRYFAYGRRSYPNIHVHHEDARVFLRGAAGRYDLIYLDVFDHLLTVPWTMVTREALSDMSARLGPGGLFIANVLSPHAGPGSAFAERFLSTTWEVFEEVTVYLTRPEADSTAIQNLIVIASDDPAALPSIPWPRAAVGPSGRALSDRWAPVEYLQASYFLQGVRWR